MFYIVAETTDDETEARTCLNLVRRNRGLVAFEDTEMVDIQQVLKEEYMKEFFGEGQLFFYYKRLNVSSIPAGDDSGMITMDEVKYKFHCRIAKPIIEIKYEPYDEKKYIHICNSDCESLELPERFGSLFRA